jgi:hypothetical protein
VLIWPILLYANKLQNSRNGLSEKAEWKGETQRKGQLRFDRMQTDREKAAENDKLFIIVILRQTGKNSLGGGIFRKRIERLICSQRERRERREIMHDTAHTYEHNKYTLNGPPSMDGGITQERNGEREFSKLFSCV